jgi:hypothetical protein
MTPLTQAAFARHLGVVKSYVTLLKQQGRLVMTDDGKVDVEASEAKIKATEDPGKSGVAERHSKNREAGQGAAAPVEIPITAVDAKKAAKTENEPTPEAVAEKTAMTYQQARAVKERYNALQAKADYEKFIGKLVEYDLARSAGAELGVLFRTTLERWPDTVTSLLVGLEESAIRSVLIEQVENILGEIAERLRTMLPEITN